MIDTEADTVATSRAYIEAVSDHDLTPLETILDDGLVATLSGDRFGKREWIDALERLLPVLIRNDIREVFVSGQRASVVYDFVTDTPAGAVICVELVTVRNGRITEIELVFDRVAFAPAQAELKARAAR
ncbi:MAG TPA: nuclear transport factor 2 family protein [Leifsonia sp.]|jgi:ketosteroid isomerase-like protein|nr:nuclear transport factor 2 family protein [Leifsonia sp.]